MMRGGLPFTCTMVSICVNHFRAKFVRNWREIREKFTTTTYSHVCWHVIVNVNFVQISHEFCAKFASI